MGVALGALAAGAVSGAAASLALALLLPAPAVGDPRAVGPVLVAGTALAQAVGALAVALWGTSRRRGGRGLRAEVGLRLLPRDVGTGVALALGALLGVGLLVGLLTDAGVTDPQAIDNSTALFAGAGDTVGFVLVAVAVVVLAPVAEEVVFRGLLLPALRRRVGTVVAVALSSALFGLLHAQPGRGGLGLVAVTGLLGVLLAAVTLRVGRLGPAIVAHATVNATTVLAIAAS